MQKSTLFFQRGEIFVIDHVAAEVSPQLYFLADLHDDRLKNKSFYRSQLVKTKYPGNNFFEVEEILKRRTNEETGVKEILVKYQFYPST